MADKKNGSPSSKAAPGGMTKREAVKRGLGRLGDAATASQLQKHIQDNYGIEMSRKHIGVEKARILKAAAEHKPAAPKPTAAKSPVQQPTTPKLASPKEASGKTAMSQGDGVQGISLADIETVKDLVERVGATSLKKLIDVMAR